MTWDFPQSHFDFICSIATLHHLQQHELLMKIKHALRPGGVLVVVDSGSNPIDLWNARSMLLVSD
jgi:SAM-dependent methyltransferase